MDVEKMRERDERDERDAYSELDPSEQKAIRFLLDCAASSHDFQPVRRDEWLAEDKNDAWLTARKLAAYELLRIVQRAAARIPDSSRRSGDVLNSPLFFGETHTIAVFCIRNDFIRTFDGFDFLFVRLFGGAVRPLNPSLFAASLLHPSVSAGGPGAAEELERAVWAHQSGPDIRDPVWFPNHPIPPLQPMRAESM